jgi:hypothetical protein
MPLRVSINLSNDRSLMVAALIGVAAALIGAATVRERFLKSNGIDS